VSLLNKDIKKLVAYYKNFFGTSNPFKIAKQLHMEIQIGDIGSKCGCYMYLKRHKCIFLNENLEEHEMTLVMAHELGHAIMHPRENCYFIKHKTLLLNTKNEIEANKFAVELLISDDFLEGNKDLTIEQVSRMLGYNKKLIELRLTK